MDLTPDVFCERRASIVVGCRPPEKVPVPLDTGAQWVHPLTMTTP